MIEWKDNAVTVIWFEMNSRYSTCFTTKNEDTSIFKQAKSVTTLNKTFQPSTNNKFFLYRFQTKANKFWPLFGGVERLEGLSLMLFSSIGSCFFFIGIALELLSSFGARLRAVFVGLIWTTFSSDRRSNM